MHRGVFGLVAITVALPSCATTSSNDRQNPFGPSEMYSRRPVHPVPHPLPPPAHQPAPRPYPPRTLSATRPQRTWYPHSTRLDPKWTTIVIHHSATSTGSARTFDRYHREKKGWDELGYHFVIGNGTETPDGFIEVGPRWESQKHGAHCKTPSNYYNDHGIGICLVGDFTKSRPTAKQMAALEELVAFLCRACSIPPSRVTTHGHVNKKTKCPGRYFAMAPLRRYLDHVAMIPETDGATLASRVGAARKPRIRNENRNLPPEQLNRSPIRADGYNKPITYRTSVR